MSHGRCWECRGRRPDQAVIIADQRERALAKISENRDEELEPQDSENHVVGAQCNALIFEKNRIL
jgi:hypothetical protein